MDLDLRKLRYFVAVAEHGTFIRAAEALHIAQPVLSRQIRSLENELRVALFHRDTRGTRLTTAGEVMLEEALSLLAAAEAAHRRVRAVAAGSPRFTVGFTPGVSIAPAVRAFSARHTDVSVEVLRMEFFHRADSVRDGQVDVGYLRLPVDTHGLSTELLFSEPQVVAVPAGHTLAGHDTVPVAALKAEQMLLGGGHGSHVGSPPPSADGAAGQAFGARNIEEVLEQVAAGRGVVVVPLSTAQYFARPDVRHILVEDLPPSHVALAWRRARRSALVADYVDIARRIAGEPDAGPSR